MIDYERLREDLKDYYGTAMAGPFPMAVIELGNVEKASPEELVRIAQKEHISLEQYQKEEEEKEENGINPLFSK